MSLFYATRANSVFASGVGLLTLTATAIGAMQAGGRAELKMRFVVGETSRYHSTAQTVVSMPVPNQPPMQTTMEADLVQQRRVVRVSPKGEGEISAIMTGGTIMQNGHPAAAPDTTPFTLYYDAHGNLTAIKGISPKDAFTGLLGSGTLGMQSAYLPSRPVRQGETWTQPMLLPGMPVGGAGKITSAWTATERVGRYQTARIRTVLTQPMKIMLDSQGQPTKEPSRAVYVFTGDLNMTFVSNFAIAEGKVIRSAGSGGVLLAQKVKTTAKPKNGKKPAPETNKIEMKMRVGYNLME